MKTLSVANPLAYLICAGVKDVENRNWKTRHRGPMLIHSCGKFQAHEFEDGDFPEKFLEAMQAKKWKFPGMPEYLKFRDTVYYPYYGHTRAELVKMGDLSKVRENPFFRNGCIIGQVDLVDIVSDSKSVWADSGQFHWILKNPILFPRPIYEIKGQLRLWNYSL